MPILSCPVPDNINALTTNGFLFSIQKYPELTYFIQNASLPDISLGSSLQSSSVHDLKLPGETMEFGTLNIDFVVDSQMKNYMAIYEWMAGLGFPKGNDQYTKFINETRNNNSYSERSKQVSDAHLSILDANNKEVKRFMFYDVFPTSMSALSFQSVNTDVNYIVANLTLEYSFFVPE